ncbi:MAG TPA: DNA polymerase III subunit gamma and tau [Streptosporangiaceae bacterium]
MAGDVSKSGGSTGEFDLSRPDLPEAPLALYRRYRPATFAEVKGQDHVTEPLRQALRSGRVNHAYLFSGPRGCGKTSSARILARSLNCEQGPTPDPCGECASCVALAPSGPGSIDVIEIDAASHGGIDDARDLRERAFYSPVSARYKIYIIDEAHMVTGAGFNALLKLVEEPPPHLKFVFATTEPEKVIPTIRSRTHHYPFRLVPPAVLRELLEEILAAEKISYEPAVLPVVIRAGAGSVRDSLSILDQLMAGADESGLRYDRAIALLGYTDDALLDEMAEAFAAREGAAVFLAIDHVVEAGHDPRRFAMDLLDRLRDLIILAAVPDAASSGLLDVPEDQLERMRAQAEQFGQERLARAAEAISAGLVEMRGATSPRLLLELMCAQVLLPVTPAAGPAGAAVPDDLTARLDRLERQVAMGGPAAASADPAGAARARVPGAGNEAGGRRASGANGAEVRSRGDGSGVRDAGGAVEPASAGSARRAAAPGSTQAPSAAGALSTAALRERWPEVLEAVRDIRRTAWILLSNFASIADVEGNVVTMAFDSEGNAKGFASSGSDRYLADVIQSMFGAQPVIRAIVQPGAGKGGGRPVQGGRDEGSASQGHDSGQVAEAGSPGGNAGHDGDIRPGQGRAGEIAGAESPQAAAEAAGSRAAGNRAARASSRPPGGTAAAGAESARAALADATGRASRGPRRPAAGELSDDPRTQTDSVPPGPAGELTGTDLIMRELGGKLIGETSEV